MCTILCADSYRTMSDKFIVIHFFRRWWLVTEPYLCLFSGSSRKIIHNIAAHNNYNFWNTLLRPLRFSGVFSGRYTHAPFNRTSQSQVARTHYKDFSNEEHFCKFWRRRTTWRRRRNGETRRTQSIEIHIQLGDIHVDNTIPPRVPVSAHIQFIQAGENQNFTTSILRV